MLTDASGPFRSAAAEADIVRTALHDDGVAVVELDRPPVNTLNVDVVRQIADVFDELGRDPRCRVIVLCSTGLHFCAGADFNTGGRIDSKSLYSQAIRLFTASVPVIAAVQGSAIGGGLGLALAADLRVGETGSRFSANFARLGIHHGFGTSVTLAAVVGQQRALELLYTGARIDGEAALRIGLVDHLVSTGSARARALELAGQIAECAPLAIRSIRQTMRGGLAEMVREATGIESYEQELLFSTHDFAEGVAAYAERRTPNFSGT